MCPFTTFNTFSLAQINSDSQTTISLQFSEHQDKCHFLYLRPHWYIRLFPLSFSSEGLKCIQACRILWSGGCFCHRVSIHTRLKRKYLPNTRSFCTAARKSQHPAERSRPLKGLDTIVRFLELKNKTLRMIDR